MPALDLPPLRRADGTPARALVVDDEVPLAEAVAFALTGDGWQVRVAHRGREVAQTVREWGPDVVVLDIMLPDLDGLEVLDRIRQVRDDVRVLFLTARDTQQDRIEGLTAGGDDYVTKPFDVPELLARARALVRTAPSMTDASGRGPLTVADLEIDEDARMATQAGVPLQLTATEFEVLRFFARNAGKVLRREQLLTAVWGYDFGAESNLVEMYVSTLRRKLAADGAVVIQTVRGVGYALKTREPDDT
ncbi:response regulator transcription factor [Gryllotalpicola ginsengisoli]|uniref:response regulator transcription factor n=1 Tax=Gryllotalpicola ginsengisoli TaxID=444608 RepID=UPI0003B6B066|nr:response regulator transcription factor [Gryllotalpicola ginsengisoli]